MNTATTWRDLTDQLTTVQQQQLTDGEHHTSPADLLDVARDYAIHNLLQITHAEIPVPAGVKATAWYDDDGAHRTLYGGRWTVGNVTVVLVGDQDATGAVGWQIEVQHVENTVGDLNAEQTRELSRLLVTAADQLDQLDGTAPPFV
jgi:hypothetical protein